MIRRIVYSYPVKLVVVMTTGAIAISVYQLLAVFRRGRNKGVQRVVLHENQNRE